MSLRQLQFEAELFSRRIPVGRFAGHRLLDRGADVDGNPFGAQIGHGCRGDPQVVRDEILVGLALMRGVAGDQRVDRRAEGVHVGRDRRRGAAEHLWCGVGQRAGEEPGDGLVATDDACGPEVAQLRFAVVVDEHVGRFDVAVQRARPVRGLQCPAQFHADTQRLGPRYPALPPHPLRERTPCVIRHHDERTVAVGDADLQDVDDVRVPGEPAHRVTLAQGTLAVVLVVEIGGEDLDGDAAPERLLVAAVHHAATTATDLDGVGEPGGCQFGRYPARHGPTLLRGVRIVRLTVPSKGLAEAGIGCCGRSSSERAQAVAPGSDVATGAVVV